MSLALWLRGGRAERGLALEDVARTTKIQVRILERLEAGFVRPSDGLPADVFVRGFVRSFAKCCGLDEAETLRRYEACANPGANAVSAGQPSAPIIAAGTTPPPVSNARARAVVEAMSDLAPRANEAMRARPVEIIHVSDPTPIGLVVASELPTAPVVTEVAPAVAPIPVVVSSVEALVAAVEIAAAATATATATDAVLDTETQTQTQTQATKKKRKGRGGKGRGKRQVSALASGTPFEALPVVPATAETAVTELAATTESSTESSTEPLTIDATTTAVTTAVDASELMAPLPPLPPPPPIDALDPLVVPAVDDEPIATVTWQPRMPPLAMHPTTTASVPWRRPLGASTATSTSRVIPSLVIDDADPDSAEQELEERAAAQSSTRRSFLPPILLDREDRSARQGGLTLAVIILLIAATLTLSYLMRRPSSSGDGITRSDAVDLTIIG